jgi:MFS family permease
MRHLVPVLPRAAWQLLAAGSLSAVANGLTYPFLVVYLHRVRELPLGLAGMAAATIAVAAIAVNLAAGPLVDRLGPRRVVAAMLVFGAAGAALLAFAETAAVALAGSALFGAGLTTGWVGLQQVLAAVVPQEQRGDAFAVQFALLNAGIGAGGLTAGLLVDFDRPATFEAVFLAAACCYLAFAPSCPSSRSRRGLLRRGEPCEAAATPRSSATAASGSSSRSTSSSSGSGWGRSRTPSLPSRRRSAAPRPESWGSPSRRTRSSSSSASSGSPPGCAAGAGRAG